MGLQSPFNIKKPDFLSTALYTLRIQSWAQWPFKIYKYCIQDYIAQNIKWILEKLTL